MYDTHDHLYYLTSYYNVTDDPRRSACDRAELVAAQGCVWSPAAECLLMAQDPAV